jgi:D-tyrosyl-tRNA(Tyr) deacylase
MRVLLQRAASASVVVGDRTVGEIGRGLVLLTGFGDGDTATVIAPMADKICGLRVFEGDDGRFQYSVNDIAGDLLAVPQFTLYGDTRRGRRPDFTGALAPAPAEALFNEFVTALQARATGSVESGVFGARMAVHLVNDGPVTLLLERDC